MTPILPFVLSLLALPGPASIQGGDAGGREPLRGRVVDRDGAAVAGVHVVLVARPDARISESGELDRREATSDEDGRFAADLLPGLDYGAVVWTTPKDDTYRTGDPVQGLVAGGTARLVLDPTPCRRVRVRVEGRAAWADQAPLRFVADSNYWETNPGLLASFDPDGKEPLPPIPGGRVSLEVRGKDGLLLARTALVLRAAELEARAEKDRDLGDEQRAERTLYARSVEQWVLQIPRPGECLLRVRLPASGKPGLLGGLLGQKQAIGAPARGAVVSYIDGVSRYELARCDDEGYARVRSPSQWGMRAQLVVDHPGCANFYVQPDLGGLAEDRDLDALRKQGKPDVEVELLPGGPLEGRLLLAEDRPLAGATLLVDTVLMMGPMSTLHFGKPLMFRTDDEGRFTVPGLPEKHIFLLSVVLPEEVRRRLQGDGEPLSPWVPLLAEAGPPEKPVTTRLDMHQRVLLEAKAEGGRTASYPEFMCAPIHEKELSSYGRNLRGDRRGRLAVLLPPGRTWAFGACLPSGISTTQVTIDRQPEPVEVRLDMTRTLRLAGVIHNANGEPLWDCRLRVTPLGEAAAALGLVDRILFTRAALPASTDEKGHFVIAVPEPDRSYKISFGIRSEGGGHSMTSSHDRQVDVGKESIDDLEFVIAAPAVKPDKDKPDQDKH
ncbi:MAG: carboxypeptidase-like regulatory domain-containing protein [Planctomycetota bacterium]